MTLFATRLGYRGVWAWCFAAQRVCFSTLLWPNDRFYAWQTDWLQRFQVCWETRAVNKKVHLHWGTQTEERLIFRHVLPQRWDTEYRTSLGTEYWQRKCMEVHLANLRPHYWKNASCPIFTVRHQKNPKSLGVTKAFVLLMAEKLVNLLSFSL